MEIDPPSTPSLDDETSSSFLHAYGFLPCSLLSVLSRFLSTREITLPASFFDDDRGLVSIGRGEHKYELDAWKMFDEGIKLGGWKTISHQLAARRLATSLSLPSLLPRAIHLPEAPRLCFDTILGPPPPTFPSRSSFSAEIIQTLWYRYFSPFETVVRIRNGIGDIRRAKVEEEKRRETVQAEWRAVLLARRAAEMRTTKDDEMEGMDVREDDEEVELEVWVHQRELRLVAREQEGDDPVSLAQLRALQPKPAAFNPSSPSDLISSPSLMDRKPFESPPAADVVHQHLPLPTPPSEPRTLPASLDRPSISTTTPKQELPFEISTLLLSPPPSTSPQTHSSSSSEPTPQRRHLSTPSPLRKTSAILVSSQTPSSFDLLQTPLSPPPTTTKRSASDPTPPKPEDGVASSSIKPHLLFPQRRTSRAPPPAQPLQTSHTTQKINSSSVPTIQTTQTASTSTTPSLVNSNKRPINPSLLAPSKKPRPTTTTNNAAHVSFLLPSNDNDKENEAAVELDLLGYKIVIGTDVQGEETREKLEEDVEMLGGEISVRTCKEDWEGDEEEEGRKVVLICWRKGEEGREGTSTAAAREEVEAAIKTGALLRTHLWVSSLKHPFSANLPEVTHEPREDSVPGFEDFKICVTDYRDHHLAIVIALVHLAGATYSRTLTDRCTHLLCPPDALRLRTTSGSTPTESPKLTQAKKRALKNPGSIRIVRDGKAWLERCLVNGGDDRDVQMERVERAVAEAAAGGASGSGSGTAGMREDDEVSLSGSLKGLLLG